MLYLVFFSKLLVWDALHTYTRAVNQRSSWEEVLYIMPIRKKQSEVELKWTRWSSIAEGYCQWDRGWITFSVIAYQESALFSNGMFRCQNIISLVPRDRLLFIAWGGGGREDYGGITWFLGEQKGGSVVTENPKGEITGNFRRITAEGEPLKFAWKMKTLGGGIAKVIKYYYSGSLQGSNTQMGDVSRHPPILNQHSLRIFWGEFA